MSRRTDELHALRALVPLVEPLLDDRPEHAAVREVVRLCRSLGPRSYGAKSAIGADCANGGRGGCVDFDLSLPKNLRNEEILKTNQNPQLAQFAQIERHKNGRPTWLTVFGQAWQARFEASPPWGQLARALDPLVKQHGETEVLQRWKNYLLGTGAQFVSPARFASTFGAWRTADPDRWRHDPSEFRPGESIDAYIARRAGT